MPKKFGDVRRGGLEGCMRAFFLNASVDNGERWTDTPHPSLIQRNNSPGNSYSRTRINLQGLWSLIWSWKDSWSTWDDLFSIYFQPMIPGLEHAFWFLWGFQCWNFHDFLWIPKFLPSKGSDCWPKFHNTGVIWWLLGGKWMFCPMAQRLFETSNCPVPMTTQTIILVISREQRQLFGPFLSTLRCRCIRVLRWVTTCPISSFTWFGWQT